MSKKTENNDDVDVVALADHIKDSDLFTIVIEGKDDKLIYDEFEEIYGLSEPLVSVLEAHGRNNALEIFKLLKDTPAINKVLFIVDQDQWVINGRDPEYNHPHIICTYGYSFENDVFIDGQLKEEMHKKNHDILDSKLPILLKWYALEFHRIKNGKQPKKLSLEITHLFNCVDEYTNPDEGETFPTAIFNTLKEEYPKFLRGKTLLKFYVNIMNDREHCNSHTYSTIATIENVCKHKGTHLNHIFSEVNKLYTELTT